MLIIKAELNKADYARWKGALNRLMQAAKVQANDVPYRQAVGYVDFIRKRIASGAITHPDYEEGYKERKQKFVGHLNPWRLTGALFESLTVERIQDIGFRGATTEAGWFGGIPGGVTSKRYSWESRKGPIEMKEIAMYARTLEFKLGNQKRKRPVMGPGLHDFRPQAKTIVADAAKKLQMVWR